MFNYNKFSNQIKAFSKSFSIKVSHELSLPISKSINDLIFGIMKSKSSLLSNISRALNEEIKIKDTVDRLSKNLVKVYNNKDIIYHNYYNSIRNVITKDTFFHIDNSDVNKDSSSKLEDLDLVCDGSDNNKLVKGYQVCEIVATNKSEDLPISLYSTIFSTITKGFKSVNVETFKAIESVVNHFGNIGTFVMDRGYDDSKYFKYFLSKGIHFIIRGKKNRNVIYNGKIINVMELSEQFKGKIKIKLFMKGKVKHSKASYVKVKLPNVKEEMYVVFVYFKRSTSIFYTNRNIEDKKDVITIINGYYMRWRIEEYFKFKKQELGFEDYRVRSLEKMNALNLMLSLSISCMNMIVNNAPRLRDAIIYYSKSIKKKVYFEYYRISTGISFLLGHCCSGIRHLYTKKRDPQISIFHFL